MNTWFDSKEVPPPTNRPILVYCPGWNNLYYQVCEWDGSKFYYGEQPNEHFHDYVEKWTLFMGAD